MVMRTDLSGTKLLPSYDLPSDEDLPADDHEQLPDDEHQLPLDLCKN